MRINQCSMCEWLTKRDDETGPYVNTWDICGKDGRYIPISKVKGCSQSLQARKFFRAHSGAEAFRMKLKPKGTTKKEVTP